MGDRGLGDNLYVLYYQTTSSEEHVILYYMYYTAYNTWQVIYKKIDLAKR